MMELERKEIELEMEERRRMEIKKNLINDAAKKQDEPVDDSKLVEAMFDFLPDSTSEAPAPTRETSVFMVCIVTAVCTSLNAKCMFYLNMN
jgi:myosin-7